MIVILSSLSTSFTFSPEIDSSVLFNIDGIPYCPPRTPSDKKALTGIRKLCHNKLQEAAETGYSIIYINNTPLTLEVLQEIQDVSVFPYASGWLFLSFFHKEEALITNKINLTETDYVDPQILLEEKNKDYERLSAYPFIKRIFIPYGFIITMNYLNSLFE